MYIPRLWPSNPDKVQIAADVTETAPMHEIDFAALPPRVAALAQGAGSISIRGNMLLNKAQD